MNAFDFVSTNGATGEFQAFLCRDSGKIYWHFELSDTDEAEEKLPDDIDDHQKYLAIPNKRELDLGKPLVLKFAREVLPDDYDEVRRMFGRRGAYDNFRKLLERRRARDQWYDYEQKAQERALREWCALESIDLAD
jgi:hypothetical protein